MTRRLGLAVALAGVMVAFVAVAPGLFVLAVAVGLLLGPIFAWSALFRLHAKVRKEERTRLPGAEPIVSLTTARNGMLLKAIGTTVTAVLAMFVVGRELGLVPQMERVVFLMLIAYPPLLSIGPAIDWLVTVGRMDR